MDNSTKAIPIYSTAEAGEHPSTYFLFRSKALDVPIPLLIKEKDVKPGDWLRSAMNSLQGKEKEVASELFFYLAQKNLCKKAADRNVLEEMKTLGYSDSYKHLLTKEVPTVPTSAVGAIVFQMAQFQDAKNETFQIIGGLLVGIRNLNRAIINKEHWGNYTRGDRYIALQNSLESIN